MPHGLSMFFCVAAFLSDNSTQNTKNTFKIFYQVPRWLILGFCLLQIIAFSSATKASPVASIGINTDKLSLTPYLDYFADLGGNFDLESISSEEMRFSFEPVKRHRIALKPTHGAQWFRFSLHNHGNTTAAPLLELFPFHFNKVEVFELSSGNTVPDQPVSSVVQKHFVHQLAIPAQTTKTYYIRLENERSLSLGVRLLSTGAAAKKYSFEHFIFSVAVSLFTLTFITFGLCAVYFRRSLFIVLIAYQTFCVLAVLGTMRLGDPHNVGAIPKLQLGALVTIACCLLIQLAWYCRCLPWLKIRNSLIKYYGFAATGAVASVPLFLLPGSSMLIYIPAITLISFSLVNLSAVIAWVKKPHSVILSFTVASFFSATLIVCASFLFVTTLTDNAGVYNLLALGFISQVAIIGGSTIYAQIKKRRNANNLALKKFIHDQQTQSTDRELSRINTRLRTPMTGILGMAELLEHTQLTTMQQDYVSTLKRSTNELLETFESTASQIRLSNITSGESKHSTFNFNQKMDEILARYKNISANRSLELICDKESLKQHWFHGDLERLRLLFGLLLGNAFDKTQSGELFLHVSDRNNDGKLLCWLSQTSSVLSTAELLAIENTRDFSASQDLYSTNSNPENQNSDTASRYILANRICRELGGNIKVNRNVPNDVLLQFEIQLEACQAPASTTLTPETLTGKKLLIVDTSSNFCNITAKQASNWGMDVITAQTVSQALAHCRNQALIGDPVDIALIEHQLPNGGGTNLAKRLIHEMKVASQPAPIIVLTTVATTRHINDGLNEIGIETSITKPIGGTALHDTLLRALGLHRSLPNQFNTQDLDCLIIAKEKTVATVLMGILKILNINYSLASTKAQAMEEIRLKNFDFIILNDSDDETFRIAKMIHQYDIEHGATRSKVITLVNDNDSGSDNQPLAENPDHTDMPLSAGTLLKPVTLGQIYSAIQSTVQ